MSSPSRQPALYDARLDGAPVPRPVAERLGHEKAHLVLTTYGHLLPDSEERTRRAIELAWYAASAPQGEANAL